MAVGGGPDQAEAIVTYERELRDREARIYDAHRTRSPYVWSVEHACVLHTLALENGQTVVDAGCGTGLYLPDLLGRAGQVIGIDHSTESLGVALERIPGEQRHRLELLSADLREVPLENAVADRVLCIEAIQHIPGSDNRRRAVAELLRVLRPGGLAVIVVYRWLGRKKKEGFFKSGLYRYAFTTREVDRLLHEVGFTDVEVGGALVLPRLGRRLGVGVETQIRVCFTPIGRLLAHYVLACARAPG
jgi:ubiquinone/menaquinone biosynthesis C-methylase UbiE